MTHEESQAIRIELERMYKEYSIGQVEGDWEPFFDMFIKFRLSVSGASEGHICRESMTNAQSFLTEIYLINNMMDDWAGCYRGDNAYESYWTLELLIENSSLPDIMKNEILNGFKSYYMLDNE